MTLMEKQRTAELRGIEIGENRGREIGIEIGENRGKEIGKGIGIEIGEKRKSSEMAKRMIADRLPLEQIIHYSGLTLPEIQALVEEMDQEK